MINKKNQKGGFLKLIMLIVVTVIIVVLFLLIKGSGGDDIVYVDENGSDNVSTTTASGVGDDGDKPVATTTNDGGAVPVDGDFFTIVLPRGWSLEKDVNADGTLSGKIKGGSRLIEYRYSDNVVLRIESARNAYKIMQEKLGSRDAILYKPKTGLGNLTGAYVAGLPKGNFTINAMHLAGPERDKILDIIRTIKFN